MLNRRRRSTVKEASLNERLSQENPRSRLTHVVVVLLLPVFLQRPKILVGQRLLLDGHPVQKGAIEPVAVGDRRGGPVGSASRGPCFARCRALAQRVEEVQDGAGIHLRKEETESRKAGVTRPCCGLIEEPARGGGAGGEASGKRGIQQVQFENFVSGEDLWEIQIPIKQLAISSKRTINL